VNFILADVPPHDAGSASGVVTMLQQFSFALGVAVIGQRFRGRARPAPRYERVRAGAGSRVVVE